MRPLVISLALLCGAGISVPASISAQALLSTQELPRQAEAQAFAEHWLDLLENQEEVESFALLTDVFRANLTPETWHKALTETHAALGNLVSRKLRRVVWYQDPKDAPLPGTYVAVEFDSVYEKASTHFRYVVLHSLKGEPFRVMRTESTFAADKSPASGEKPSS